MLHIATVHFGSPRWIEDPILFSVYGDVVYHHGAGSRVRAFTRGHNHLAPEPLLPVPRVPVARQLAKWVNGGRWVAWRRKAEKQQDRQAQEMYAKIAQGGSDWLQEIL